MKPAIYDIITTACLDIGEHEMKKTLIINVKMNDAGQKTVYTCDDMSIPVSGTPVVYPVMGFLEETLTADDEVEALLLVKTNDMADHEKNIEVCREELKNVSAKTGAAIFSDVIYTPFEEDINTHNQLLLDIVRSVEIGSHITVDMTYGPKDLAIVLFAALNFVEKFCDCEVDNIMYGKAQFKDGKPVNTKICEMAPLFYQNAVVSKVFCDSPEKAFEMLEKVLGM